MTEQYVNWCKRRSIQLELTAEALKDERDNLESLLDDENVSYDRLYKIIREVRGAEYQLNRALHMLVVLKDILEYEHDE